MTHFLNSEQWARRLTGIVDEPCPRCGKNRRPLASDLGIHPLHISIGRDICPECYMETQDKRLQRGRAKVIPHESHFETIQRIHKQTRDALEERRAAIRDRDAEKALIRDEVQAEVRRLSFFGRVRFAFFGPRLP